MNRNVESHFSMLPSADIQRSRFDRSQDIKFTFNVGDLIPFFVDEVLPGDTFDITTSKVVRMQTLLTPVMDNIYLDTYFFFVPNRLVWTHWRELMGENTQSAWIPSAEYTVPVIKLQATNNYPSTDGEVAVGDIADYMGIPVGVSASNVANANIPEFNALPIRAYQLIYNDWFRDENLVDPVNLQTGDTNYKYGSSYVPKKPYKAAKYHDYFTSCLPGPQKGPNVSVPTSYSNYDANGKQVGWSVITSTKTNFPSDHRIDATDRWPIHYTNSSGTLDRYGAFPVDPYYVALESGGSPTGSIKPLRESTATGDNASTDVAIPNNLWALPTSTNGSGIFIDINDLRYAFQLQKLYERDARGGEISCLHVKKIEEKNWKAA